MELKPFFDRLFIRLQYPFIFLGLLASPVTIWFCAWSIVQLNEYIGLGFTAVYVVLIVITMFGLFSSDNSLPRFLDPVMLVIGISTIASLLGLSFFGILQLFDNFSVLATYSVIGCFVLTGLGLASLFDMSQEREIETMRSLQDAIESYSKADHQ